MARTKVGIVGASGQTGESILNGLLDAGGFDIIAYARPSSMDKPANTSLKQKGVELRKLDLATDSQETIVSALQGVEVLISAVGATAQMDQIPLATAAKTAGVKRFVPCAYISVIPVGGVHMLRDQKEEVYNHMKRLGLPYTIIDVGWWYQISFPNLPSGKIDYAINIPDMPIAGDGNQVSALTDLADIGPYVARVIKDDRTLNKQVLVFNEMWSQNQVYDLLEKLSGEKIPRQYMSLQECEERIATASKALQTDPGNFGHLLHVVGTQYMISWGIRGDNTPEYAKYLGYLTSKELYPDYQYVKYEDFLKQVVAGKAKPVYEDLKKMLQSAMGNDAPKN